MPESRGATLVVLGLILVLALMPGDASASPIFGWDKLDHIAAFTALTVLARCAWPGQSRLLTALVVLGVGVLIELLQGFPGLRRQPSAFDVLADIIGIALGLGAAAVLSRVGEMLPWLNRR